MSASFPVPAPGPFNAQSPVFPQPFPFPAEAYQQGFNPSSNPFSTSNGAHHSNPMFDAKQMNGYGYTSSQGPMGGGATLISPTANVQAPFGAHPMRQFHQAGMPKPCVAIRPRMLQHMTGVMPMNGQMHQIPNQQPPTPMSHQQQQQQQQLQQHQQQQQQLQQQQQQQLQQQQQMQHQQQQHLQHQQQQQQQLQQAMHQQASSSQQMPSQSPSQAHTCSSPMQCNRQSPGSNRVVYSTNTMRPPSNGNSHLKSEQSPAGMQQTSSDQMSMNPGMSAGPAMSPASCSVFGGSSQPPQASDQGPPQPPNVNTPFPLVTHYDMPPAFQHLQESFQMRNPALQMYYKRRKTLLVLPYPSFPNLSNVAPVEPPTFAFLPHTKHYDVVYDRRYPTMNPMLQGQPGMHNRQPVQSPQMMSPAFTQPQPPNKAKGPPAKKARSDSTDGNFPGMSSNSGMMIAPGCMPPPRHMQQMPPDMLQHYGAVPTSQMGMNPTGMQQYYPSVSPNAVPTSVVASVSNTPSMNMSNGMYPMAGVPHSAASMNMGRISDMSQPVNDNRSQQVPVSGVFQNMSNGRMSTGDQQSLNSPRNQTTQLPYQQQGSQFDISPQCPKCLCLVSPTNRSVQCNGPCMRLFHQNCTGLLPRAFALLEEDPSAKWVCGACESSVM